MRTSSFRERARGKKVRKEREGWESKREIKIRDAIKHFAEIASGLIRGIISRINSWKGKGGGGNGEVGERGDDKLKYTVR